MDATFLGVGHFADDLIIDYHLSLLTATVRQSPPNQNGSTIAASQTVFSGHGWEHTLETGYYFRAWSAVSIAA